MPNMLQAKALTPNNVNVILIWLLKRASKGIAAYAFEK